jgi:hypothetical protein
MSTNRSVGRSSAAQQNDRFAVTHKKDRSGLCAFTFADGRHCRTPRRSGHPHLCYFHAQKEAQSRAAKQAGEDISSFFCEDFMSACDLSSALGRAISAVARGELKPKAATALAYLGQTLNQSIKLAQDEYIGTFGTNSWRSKVASCFVTPTPAPRPVSQLAPPEKPATPHVPPSDPETSSSDSSS